MIVYRISSARYAKDLTGEGARLYGGRWNHRLTACVYTSASRALAVLEYTVNITTDDIPRALSIVSIDIPDEKIFEITAPILPGNWKEAPAPASTKDFGTSLLKKVHFPVIKMPSAIIPQEFNFILNPLHPDSKGFVIADIQDFVYDLRIKSNETSGV
jgi:RES domain-containing protein